MDKFGDYLSFQIVSLGMEQWKDAIVETLIDLFHPAAICERGDVPVREKEGLPQAAQVIYGTLPELVRLREHDAGSMPTCYNGQKTGHFLDQQENRGRLKPYAPGRTVLDLCCHSGGFGIHAGPLRRPVRECVDVSEEALALVRKNAAENGVQVTTTCANVFDLVKSYDEAGRRFGLVICDPPAFAKSRKALEAAYRGYKELNLRCLRLTKPGGFLVTCSCSQFMTPPLFEKMLTRGRRGCGTPHPPDRDADPVPGPPRLPHRRARPVLKGPHRPGAVARNRLVGADAHIGPPGGDSCCGTPTAQTRRGGLYIRPNQAARTASLRETGSAAGRICNAPLHCWCKPYITGANDTLQRFWSLIPCTN